MNEPRSRPSSLLIRPPSTTRHPSPQPPSPSPPSPSPKPKPKKPQAQAKSCLFPRSRLLHHSTHGSGLSTHGFPKVERGCGCPCLAALLLAACCFLATWVLRAACGAWVLLAPPSHKPCVPNPDQGSASTSLHLHPNLHPHLPHHATTSLPPPLVSLPDSTLILLYRPAIIQDLDWQLLSVCLVCLSSLVYCSRHLPRLASVFFPLSPPTQRINHAHTLRISVCYLALRLRLLCLVCTRRDNPHTLGALPRPKLLNCILPSSRHVTSSLLDEEAAGRPPAIMASPTPTSDADADATTIAFC